ncbi:hypothetical protein [Streptomyces gilvus]|uniref:hypothetical protein n=1 Tax=Streptomyces gilvus TaxID=2920937 RepID=UPI001F0D48F3|nr:hypothetical protein [Streptomyces sp. CME 23]MCH5676815.1 hypothetical protein [Streptomyces sp. CME 23]
MSHAAETGEEKVDVERLVELAKRLENVKSKDLKRALKAINYEARTQRWNAVLSNLNTAFGITVSGFLVVAFVWLGYQLVLRNQPGWCVAVCGVPLTSISTIFVLKKNLAGQVMDGFTKKTRSGAGAQMPAVPQQSASADSTDPTEPADNAEGSNTEDAGQRSL